VLKILWSFVIQLANMVGEILILVFTIAGISIMVKYLGKAMILALPLMVLFAGIMLLAYMRWRKRMKARRESAQRALRSAERQG
jgi:sensor c-di-GMP phosphodiesterase-like protein